MIDAGADVIIGHGPHVTRAMEIYQDRFIAYSLATFVRIHGLTFQGLMGLHLWSKYISTRKGN
jgi:hypothetical protein